MTVPGFTAEASLQKSSKHYRKASNFGVRTVKHTVEAALLLRFADVMDLLYAGDERYPHWHGGPRGGEGGGLSEFDIMQCLEHEMATCAERCMKSYFRCSKPHGDLLEPYCEYDALECLENCAERDYHECFEFGIA